ncbi:hypothetical protein M9Y10_044155 [Tritrichomonas musculus]|uniref:Uncharacterized protein n=1 Tax=Tritrichomonas musculus TaxID=1915356 RepID=A0ABR2K270_9EUKA
MPSSSSISKFISFSLLLLVLVVSKFIIQQKPNPVISSFDIFDSHPIAKFLLTNPYVLISFHVFGILIAFTSAYILECALFPSFLLLSARFLLFAPYIDFVFAFSSIGFFIISLSTRVTSKYRKLTPLFIIISGIYSSLCINILIEFITIGLFSFFSILFFWLKSHRIGNDDGSAAPDAIATVGTFIISFAVSFFLFGYIFGFPKYSPYSIIYINSKQTKIVYWKFTDTFKIFPILSSRMALSSIPAFFSNLEIGKKLLCFTAIFCAEFFRFLPFSTESANFDIIILVSASFFDLASLVFITGVSTRFVGIFSSAIYVSLSLLMQFAFHLF